MSQSTVVVPARETSRVRTESSSSGRRTKSAATLPREAGAFDPILDEQIRRQFFRSGGEAARYRVSVDDVLAHLMRAGLPITPRPQRVLAHMADVIQVIACVRGDATAWNDLLNAHAWCLDRACAEQLGMTQGLTFARRFWRRLRSGTRGEECGTLGAPSLRQYSGVRPIRLWLADRMLGAAAGTNSATGAGADTRTRRGGAGTLDSGAALRTLPLPAGHAGGSAT